MRIFHGRRSQTAPAVTGRARRTSALFACACSLLLFLIPSPPALAHEVRPAYLELRQTAADTYDILWKVPGRGRDMRLGLDVELPVGCSNVKEPYATMAGNAFIERWTVRRAGGLAGTTIHIAGLRTTTTDVLVRLEHLDGSVQVTRLTPDSPSFVVEAVPRAWAVARTYVELGIEHILRGADHLMFVLGLLLLVDRRWGLLFTTITAFTLAHSITLALATLGFVHAPQAPVEAVIALSIMFVASEILHSRAGQLGLTARAPWVVAFTFGLLHGFGFAGALSEVGIPANSVPLALFMFNVGVEIGQLVFVMAAIAVVAALRSTRIQWPRWVEAIPPYAIGTCAAFWTIQRTSSFLSF